MRGGQKVILPYLFRYKPILAISREPKLLMHKINLMNTNCKFVLLRVEIEFNCVNFVKKMKRTTAGHDLALEVLEAPQKQNGGCI